jgi:hypothetical protein
MVSAVKAIDAVKNIIWSVWVDYIHNHANPHAMRAVNKVLEFVRGPLPAGDSKIVGYVVAKASVICMLLDSHHLDHVIPTFFNSR